MHPTLDSCGFSDPGGTLGEHHKTVVLAAALCTRGGARGAELHRYSVVLLNCRSACGLEGMQRGLKIS